MMMFRDLKTFKEERQNLSSPSEFQYLKEIVFFGRFATVVILSTSFISSIKRKFFIAQEVISTRTQISPFSQPFRHR